MTERFQRIRLKSSEYGRMAQLVEHIVHIDGVTGSSPVATTMKTLDFQGFFHFLQGQIPQPYPNRLFVSVSLNGFVR